MDLASSFLSCIRRAAAVSLFLSIVLCGQAQDFNWSWEDGDGSGSSDGEGSAKEQTPPGGDGFNWSWEEGGKEGGTSVPGKEETARAEVTTIRDDAAYQKLLTENLELRRKMAEAMKDEQLARRENDRLSSEIRDMENNLAASVQLIKELKAEGASAQNPEQVSELEVKLAQAEKEKESLAGELDRLKRTRGDDARSAADRQGIAEGSDLFQEKERENNLLKRRLAEIEIERRKMESEAARAREEADKARQEAEKAKASASEISEKAVLAARQGAEYRKIVEKMPEIEKQITDLKSDVSARDEKLSAREQQLAAMTTELERREYRLEKAQKMAELLERARAEVQMVNNKEKLDMHYNMAVIYSKEGRVRDAENEYLKALRLDPADADIHYNLGILYDQDLKDGYKAAVHYRRYIALRPNAVDVDQVKSWLIDLEMDN